MNVDKDGKELLAFAFALWSVGSLIVVFIDDIQKQTLTSSLAAQKTSTALN